MHDLQRVYGIRGYIRFLILQETRGFVGIGSSRWRGGVSMCGCIWCGNVGLEVGTDGIIALPTYIEVVEGWKSRFVYRRHNQLGVEFSYDRNEKVFSIGWQMRYHNLHMPSSSRTHICILPVRECTFRGQNSIWNLINEASISFLVSVWTSSHHPTEPTNLF